jgi:hypothetical protein
MKCPTFFEGVTLALAVSIGGSLLASIFSTVLPANMVLHLLIAGPAFVYVIYLLSRSKERTGRVTVIAVWCVAAASIWVFSPSFVMYAVLHLILIWLVRSLYFSGSWTGSIFLSLWCFFLIQALFVFIPTSWRGRTFSTMETPVTENPFDIAHRAAEAAVRKLSQ